MLWFLVGGLFSIGLVVSGLADIAAGVLMLLRQAVEDVAGERAAGAVVLVVLTFGIAGGAYYLRERPASSESLADARSNAAPEARRIVSPRRATSAPTRRQGVTRCGHGTAPADLEPNTWARFRCTPSSEDGCLSWKAYASRPFEGCPGTELCCPGEAEDSARQETSP